MRVAVLLLVAGCMVRTTTATPSELAVHAPAFTRQGHADLVRGDGHVRVSADERVTVRLEEGGGLQRIETMTVRELVDGCNVEGPDQGCLARRAVSEPVLHHRERQFDSERMTKLIGLSAIGGIVGYCASECQDDGSLKRGFAYTGAVVGGIMLLGILLMVVGH